MAPLIEVKGLSKVYRMGGVDFPALKGVLLKIEKGEFVAIMGPSGSGKSTFMNIIGCLDTPTEGIYTMDEQDVSRLTRDELAAIRNKKIGFVFQSFNLLTRMTALENVVLPIRYSGAGAGERHERGLNALKIVGLEEKARNRPNQLSGGQQQRVAIARALINNPSLIFADEPTGNLDSQTSSEIMKLFQKLNSENGITVVMVTHEADIAGYAKRRIYFRDGMVVKDDAAA
ncbi:MAG: macrolide ABC transporter ATP-binding protein [Deltaproteobacteria bacterium GWC2_42_11]|nr:MAG: macrolide ABC transporter ATP-binding protein [Deltaproteobacteria bacterium GWC2_42_11]HBO84109.1 macrolide ABC transporter ATP-binding protein [Deltaproteobacteria bacterium]